MQESFFSDYVIVYFFRCERIRGIFERAGHKHLPTKVDLHTRWVKKERKKKGKIPWWVKKSGQKK